MLCSFWHSGHRAGAEHPELGQAPPLLAEVSTLELWLSAFGLITRHGGRGWWGGFQWPLVLPSLPTDPAPAGEPHGHSSFGVPSLLVTDARVAACGKPVLLV